MAAVGLDFGICVGDLGFRYLKLRAAFKYSSC